MDGVSHLLSELCIGNAHREAHNVSSPTLRGTMGPKPELVCLGQRQNPKARLEEHQRNGEIELST